MFGTSTSTQLPTWLGNWVPWRPFSMLQAWPFCYWYAAVLDQYTRAVVGWGLFRGQPNAKQMCAVLSRACKSEGTAPRHLISDRGAQFGADYRRWCQRRGVKPRFGAVHQHGSIAIIERFFRTLKTEMLRRLGVVPLRAAEMRGEIGVYLDWYHRHRPHQGLGGLTPAERGGCAAAGAAVAAAEPVEVRARYPLARAGPGPPARRVAKLELVVERLEGRRHLPVVSLREAA